MARAVHDRFPEFNPADPRLVGMTPAARIAAAAEVLDTIGAGASAERALTNWTRTHRFAGSKDRAALRDLVFDALRRRRCLATWGGGASGRALMLGSVRAAGTDPDTVFTGIGHAPEPLSSSEREAGSPPRPGTPEALDCPDWLWPLFQSGYGAQAEPILKALQARAPVHLRVNSRKAEIAVAQVRLGQEGIETVRHPLSPTALEIHTGSRALRQSGSYAEGWVELQDAASQAFADSVPLRNGGRMLDFCAGGGGKSLAVAGRVSGQFVAHDVAPRRMADLPARARRAGVKIETIGTRALARVEPFDTVLTDVPCSGSGSWRRDPQGKWTLNQMRLETLCAQQDAILTEASQLVRKGGHLVYGTCSLLAKENDDRVNGFMARSGPEWVLESQRQLTPLDGGDGFFWAVLRRL